MHERPACARTVPATRCARACKCQQEKDRDEWRSILSTLQQESSISLNLTAANLWLHYYGWCFILIPTYCPGGGLFNGEGDQRGHFSTQWALFSDQ